jgi:hypothetical protein
MMNGLDTKEDVLSCKKSFCLGVMDGEESGTITLVTKVCNIYAQWWA